MSLSQFSVLTHPVLYRLRYKLSVRDLAEMFLERGFAFTHETVRDWEARFAPLIGDQLRRKRRGQVSTSWHVDETYGHACTGAGATSIVPLIMMATWWTPCSRAKRDMDAAQRFFQQALETVGHAPSRVTTDGHDSYPRAIRETLGGDVLHRCNHYLNNLIEQDHRGIKQRYSPMRGFGHFSSAARFCRAFDELRQFFRFRTTTNQAVSLAHQRERFLQRLDALQALVVTA